LRAGTLRHKVRIEVPVVIKAASGSPTTSWQLWREVFANIETLKGYERQAVNASWPGVDGRITIRYVAGLLPTMRIVHDDKIYSIIWINDIDERHREVEIMTQQGVKPS